MGLGVKFAGGYMALGLVTAMVFLWWNHFGLKVWLRSRLRLPRERQLVNSERLFEVRLCDLGTPLSLADLEAKEVVVDPLGAAPIVAFGHLNPVWTKFRQDIAPEDQLQPFDVVWKNQPYFKERRTGYARVRGNEILGFFVDQVIGDASNGYTTSVIRVNGSSLD